MNPAYDTVLAGLRRWAARLRIPEDCLVLGGALGDALERSFPLPADDPRYLSNRLAPGALPFERSFCQRAPGDLRIDFEPFGPELGPEERLRESERLLRALSVSAGSVVDHLLAGFAPLSSLAGFGAFFGLVFDRAGLRECKVYREVDRPEALSPRWWAIWKGLQGTLPGISPLMCSLGVTRGATVERLYVRCREGLRLNDLLSLDRGIADRVPALAEAVYALTGGLPFLPPDGAIAGFRRVEDGWELKLEILHPALPRDSAQRMALVKRALLDDQRAFHSWLGPEGGDISVVSVRVSARGAPALNVYVRPWMLEGAHALAAG